MPDKRRAIAAAQAPLSKIGVLANDSLRIEPCATSLRLVAAR